MGHSRLRGQLPRRRASLWIGLSFPLAAIRRDAWAERRFYDAAWGSEDTEWGIWARRQGYNVRYVAQALTMHSHNYTFRQLHGRKFIEGEADVFIHPEKPAPLRYLLARALVDGLRDAPYCIKRAAPWRIPEAVARRVAGEWAYYKGHRHGSKRRRQGGDASFGQNVVLSRYE